MTLMLILLSLMVGTPSPSLRGGVPPRRHLVEIRGFAFQPAVLQVARGDTVVWINRDIVPHTATPTGKAQWDTGTLTQGQEGRHILRRRGSFSYVCTLHPTMKGTLIVTDP